MVQSKNKEEPQTLKELRDKAQLSQRELASRLGTSHDMIVHWEKGRKVPRFDNAIALASELGVSLRTLAKVMGFDVSKIPIDD
jgi:transcriptional regulator with XRE-family HTH domain